jgi:hypothetical protein
MPTPAANAAENPVALPVDVAQLHKKALDSCSQNGQSFMLYTQIYDEAQRAEVLKSLTPVRELGINVPGIENVTQTAKRNGRRAPFEWKTPTVLYAPDGRACATALVDWANVALPSLARMPARAIALPPGMGSANSLELWIPRPRAKY